MDTLKRPMFRARFANGGGVQGLQAALEAIERGDEGSDTGPSMPSGAALRAMGASLMKGGRNPYNTTSGLFSDLGAGLEAANAVQTKEAASEAAVAESRKTRQAANTRSIYGEMYRRNAEVEKAENKEKKERLKEVTGLYKDIITGGLDQYLGDAKDYVGTFKKGIKDDDLDPQKLRDIFGAMKVEQERIKKEKDRHTRLEGHMTTIRKSGDLDSIRKLNEWIQDPENTYGIKGLDESELSVLAGEAEISAAKKKAADNLHGSSSVWNLEAQLSELERRGLKGSRKWKRINAQSSKRGTITNRFIHKDVDGNWVIAEGDLNSFMTNLQKSRKQMKVSQGEQLVLELERFKGNIRFQDFGMAGVLTGVRNSIAQFLPFLHDPQFVENRTFMGAIQEKGIALMRAFPSVRLNERYINTIRKIFPTDTPFKGKEDALVRTQTLIAIIKDRTIFEQNELDPNKKSILEMDPSEIIEEIRGGRLNRKVGSRILETLHMDFLKTEVGGEK